MNTILNYSKKSTRIQNTFISTLPQFRSFALLRFTNGKCSLWKLVNHLIWINYQPIRALRPLFIGRMHVNVIGILAGSLSLYCIARSQAIQSLIGVPCKYNTLIRRFQNSPPDGFDIRGWIKTYALLKASTCIHPHEPLSILRVISNINFHFIYL